VVLGHVSVDENIIIDKTFREPGGGVFFAAVAAGRLGMKVTAITKCLRSDIPLFAPAFGEAKVKTKFLPSPASTSCQNHYPSTNPEDRRQKFLSLAAPFTEADLSAATTQKGEWPDSIVYLNALWMGEVPEALIPCVRNRPACKFLIGDAQGFVRQIHEGGKIVRGDWLGKKEYLKHFDLFKVDSGEGLLLCGTDDLQAAARELVTWGARSVIATNAEGVLVFDGKWVYSAKFGSYAMVGRTGRGDTTTIAYIAAGGLDAPSRKARQSAVDSAARIATAKMQYAGPYRG